MDLTVQYVFNCVDYNLTLLLAEYLSRLAHGLLWDKNVFWQRVLVTHVNNAPSRNHLDEPQFVSNQYGVTYREKVNWFK